MTADDYLYAAKREMVDRIIVGAGEEERMRRRSSSSSSRRAIERDREGPIVEASSLSSMYVCVSEHKINASPETEVEDFDHHVENVPYATILYHPTFLPLFHLSHHVFL
jgi:hypothetical protein